MVVGVSLQFWLHVACHSSCQTLLACMIAWSLPQLLHILFCYDCTLACHSSCYVLSAWLCMPFKLLISFFFSFYYNSEHFLISKPAINFPCKFIFSFYQPGDRGQPTTATLWSTINVLLQLGLFPTRISFFSHLKVSHQCINARLVLHVILFVMSIPLL